MKITTTNDQETRQFGQKLATTLPGGTVVCLHGDLGAGKTTLVKGMAEGFGISEEITSPTFTLMNIYKVKNNPTIKQLVHIDTYRLKSELELIDIGIDDYMSKPGTITIVEWPEKISNLLQNKKVINIYIDHQTEISRTISITN